MTNNETGDVAATISVRQAELSDVDLVAPLFDGYRQFYRQEPDLALARSFIHERLLRHESVIFLAQDRQGRPLGFAQLYPSFTSVGAQHIWILNDLFVVPSARGAGTGRTLLNAARRHATATGARRLELSTAHDNPARRLYESEGYVQEEGFVHYSLTL